MAEERPTDTVRRHHTGRVEHEGVDEVRQGGEEDEDEAGAEGCKRKQSNTMSSVLSSLSKQNGNKAALTNAEDDGDNPVGGDLGGPGEDEKGNLKTRR